MLEDGVPDEEAVQRLLDTYTQALTDVDEGPVVWLALAVSQSRLGRPDGQARALALDMIDGGAELARWVGTPQVARRRAVLNKVRARQTRVNSTGRTGGPGGLILGPAGTVPRGSR